MSSIAHGVMNMIAPGASFMTDWNKKSANNVANPNNEGFNNAAKKYQENIDSNTGKKGYDSGYNMAKKNASDMTQLQSNGAASQALGNAVSAGQTRGRAADMAAQSAANAYTNNYANNMNNQQGMANQALANQLNAQGTLMGAQLTNDQAQYQQNWNNYTQGSKMNAGAGFFDVFSDENAKDTVKVGKGSDDLRMIHYRNCGKKLKSMNPNKWEELKWRNK